MQTVSALSVLPPAFVMNVYYTGVGIARNLHSRGVEVYGLSSENTAPGINSRFFDGIYKIPNGRDEPESLHQKLLEIRANHSQAPVIFPTRDFDVLFLHQYREQLAPFYRLAQPGGQVIPLLLDKFEIATVSNRHHIPIPKTVICTSPGDIDRQIGLLKFPLVIKPRYAYQWRQGQGWEKVGGRKAVQVESVDQLREEYWKLRSVTKEVLLQEYVGGGDTDLVVCGCYINQDGKLLGYFTARKLRQNPPLLGTGCVVEAADIPEIIAPSLELLRACDYVGLAEVEFKCDKRTGVFFLIEINPRHWDQHELGKLVGVNLTWVAYQDLIGRHPQPQLPAYKESVRCKWIAERELALLLMRNAYLELAALKRSESWMSPGLVAGYLNVIKKTLRELASLLRGRKVFGIFHLRDPLPGLSFCFRFLRDFTKILALQISKLFLATKSTPGLKNTLGMSAYWLFHVLSGSA